MKWETVALIAGAFVLVWYVSQASAPVVHPVTNSGLQPIAPSTSPGITANVTPLF